MAGAFYSVSKVNVILVVVLFRMNCSMAYSKMPVNARVGLISIKVYNGEIRTALPKISLGLYYNLLLSGKDVSLLSQAVLTKKRGKPRTTCNPSDFVSRFLDLHPYRDFSNSSQVILSLPPSVTQHLVDLDEVWICLALKNVDSANPLYFHIGDKSKLLVEKRDRLHLRSKRSGGENSTNEAAATLPQKRFSSENSYASVVVKSANNEYTVGSEGASAISRRDNRSENDADILLLPGSVSKGPTGRMVKEFQRMSQLQDWNSRIFGLRVNKQAKGISYDGGTILIQAGEAAEIRLFGVGLRKNFSVQFTSISDEFGSRCDVSTSDVFQLTEANGQWAIVTIRLPAMVLGQKHWYICLREDTEALAVHQGPDNWLTVTTYTMLLPIWLQAIIIVILLILSGLFSGLNLGLMALDKTELKIVSNTGTATERRYAKAIEPVRRHGNFLLCTLLLGNVLVNSTLTILLDSMSTGLIAVIGSTIGIVIFGEILPQAICSRYGLAVGARTVWLVRIFMVITGVISWPISKILDLALGEEIGSTYDRDRLKELIRVTQDRNDLRLEEQNIICGALELHQKTVVEVMTKLEDVYMISIDAVLDFNIISEIMQQGYSRIPIYEKERKNIVSVLFIKDLAFIDPDDNTPLRTLSQFYQNVCNFVFEDTTLDVMFKEFKEGSKGHMAFVQRVNDQGDCDPFYEVTGLVTLEDVIEELIQEEIVDETDVVIDNRTRRKRKQFRKRRDFKEFTNNPSCNRKVQISPQLQIAAFQYLRTAVEPFKEAWLSESILEKLLHQDIIHVIKPDTNDQLAPENFIYQQSKVADFFVLIMEGQVNVTIGKENLSFESGPFTYFGVAALTYNSVVESPLPNIVSRSGSLRSPQAFAPDYSVRATNDVTFLRIRWAHYVAARQAFLLEQSQKEAPPEETFEKQMEKILKDEYANSNCWTTEPYKENSPKDNMSNGSTTMRSRSEHDNVESSLISDLDESRSRSLKENLVTMNSINSECLKPCYSNEDFPNVIGGNTTQNI